MIVIACVDQKNGMMFHCRRQSRDRRVRRDIMNVVGEKTLWMNAYSYEMFRQENGNFSVADDFLNVAGKDDYCFVENCLIPEEKVNKMILYRWDKNYPQDFALNMNLEQWKLKSTLEFAGYSHETIMREVYERYTE